MHWWVTDGTSGGNFQELGAWNGAVSKITYDVSAGSDAMMEIGGAKLTWISDGTDWYVESMIPIVEVASGIAVSATA